MAVIAIAQKSQPDQHSTALAPHSRELMSWIVMELGKLAIAMGEPMTPERQTAMALALSYLPREALRAAFQAWLRGDKSHLSEYEANHTRVGAFFPKPAELIAIAESHLSKQRRYESTQRVIEEARQAERDRALHPENYVAVRDIFAAVIEKKLKHVEPQPAKLTKCPHCGSLPNASASSSTLTAADHRALADAIDRRGAAEQEEVANGG